MNSITKRWVRGSLLMTIVVLLMAETVFLYFTISSSYDTARRALLARTSTLITQISASDTQSNEGLGIVLRRTVEQFAEKEKFELMLMDTQGKTAVSTTGYVPQQNVVPQDYLDAYASEDDVGQDVYRSLTGEKVMAVTMMLPKGTDELVAIRMATSLTALDENILKLVLLSLCVVAAVVLFTLWSGLFFIRSIVRPISDIEHTAAKMAEGNLDIRLENKYNDEIGKLSDTINHMASELDKSDRLKNEFISSVSHELRTPLTSIKGWVETIANIKDPQDVNYRRGVQVIAGETDRLYAMVEELLDFSRMQNGLQLELQVVDLVAEVSDTALMVEQRIQIEGMYLQYDEPEMPIPVMADPARLRQVLLNVLDNALKYSFKDGIISIFVACDAGKATVSVADQGKGISPEDLENVKIKFFKGKGAVRGSGIGLAVADEIVEAHGGTVDIASQLGKGTSVTMCLPIYDKNAFVDKKMKTRKETL